MIIVPKFNLSVIFISELYKEPLNPLNIFKSKILEHFIHNEELKTGN
ncbi:hypothetical protein [Lysinibacillus endophyticus]|nr:hypothetical protein [Lysinibacillus endophyticus]MCP1146078.1 hypothetical protein [Lysinibacillus endophyticus]